MIRQTAGVALPASGGTDELPRADIRSWLVDTRCKHDLTTRDAIPYCQIGMIEKGKSPVLLSTANDVISCDIVVPQQIGAFGVDAEPCVLDQSPDALSIRRRCVQDGYSFQWRPYSLAPTLKRPDGKIVKVVSRDSCPTFPRRNPTTHRRRDLRRLGRHQRRAG